MSGLARLGTGLATVWVHATQVGYLHGYSMLLPVSAFTVASSNCVASYPALTTVVAACHIRRCNNTWRISSRLLRCCSCSEARIPRRSTQDQARPAVNAQISLNPSKLPGCETDKRLPAAQELSVEEHGFTLNTANQRKTTLWLLVPNVPIRVPCGTIQDFLSADGFASR